jgi:hypothetical protein
MDIVLSTLEIVDKRLIEEVLTRIKAKVCTTSVCDAPRYEEINIKNAVPFNDDIRQRRINREQRIEAK